MLATVTPQRIAPLSVSTERKSEAVAPLPPGVELTRHGLILPDGLSYDAWLGIGRRVSDNARVALWAIGDWLAYGQDAFAKTHWGNRPPSELYERLAKETGYAEHTIQNARAVCKRLPLSRRRDNVTFGHAAEIVGRCRDESDVEAWVDVVSQGGLSVKSLREKLRKSTSEVKSEPHDFGEKSVLEIARQFARDYASSSDKITPAVRVKIREILSDVIADLSR